jgi:hypothetical protein
MPTDAESYQFILLYVLLPIAGIGLIAGALIWGKRLGKRSVAVDVKRFGVALKADLVGLLVLSGFVLASIGAFFAYQRYEQQMLAVDQKYKDAVKRHATEMALMRQEMSRLKNYDLPLYLVFPEKVDTRFMTPQIWLKKSHEHEYRPQLVDQNNEPGNVISIHLQGVMPGDRYRVIVHENSRLVVTLKTMPGQAVLERLRSLGLDVDRAEGKAVIGWIPAEAERAQEVKRALQGDSDVVAVQNIRWKSADLEVPRAQVQLKRER